MPCTLGGGAHGYLGAILTAVEYAAATPINTPPFIDPIFPGDAAIIPPNSTGPQIVAIECQFNKALWQWTEYKNLTDTGKKFIQDGIDDMYLKGITNRNVDLPMSQSERYWNSCFKIMGTSLNMTSKTMIKN